MAVLNVCFSQAYRPTICRFIRRLHDGYRKLHSVASSPTAITPALPKQASLQLPDVQSQILALVRSSHRHDPSAWLKILENQRVLLSASNGQEASAQQDDFGRKNLLQSALTVLYSARTRGHVDPIAYTAKSEERWLGMQCTIDLLLDSCSNFDPAKDEESKLPWMRHDRTRPQTLDKLLGDSFHEFDSYTERNIKSATLKTHELSAKATRSISKQALFELWQSLASIVIEAEHLRDDRRAHMTIMLYFVDILAQLHKNNSVPSTIYNYELSQDSTVIQRPPLLYCLSSRILSHITSVAWNTHWYREIMEAEMEGYRLPAHRAKPRFEAIGSEIWLEFLLWACIESGGVSEAAWILSQLDASSKDSGKAWYVISWDDVCRKQSPKVEWTTSWKLQLERTILNQRAQLGQGRSTLPVVDMGARTISLEVVIAVLDGLANELASAKQSRNRPVEILSRIRSCQNLLHRSGYSLDANKVNGVILRVLENSSMDFQQSPSSVEGLVSHSPVLSNAYEPNEAQQSSFEESDMDPSASILGLVHRNLEAYTIASDEKGVSRCLESIVNVIDANRNLYIREFANDLRQRLEAGGKDNVQQGAKPSSLLHPQLPLHVLDELLGYITDNRLNDMGDFLFHNEEVDGGFIHSHVFAQPELQPRLIQYAVAHADQSILTRVIEQVQPPIPSQTIRALLGYRILMHQWQTVEDMLRQLSKTRGTAWTAGDLMTIAAYIIRKSETRDDNESLHAKDALHVLNRMLSGSYDPPREPSQPRDFSRIRLANQLKRILLTIPGGSFDSLPNNPSREAGRLSQSSVVPTGAFNILLEAVVEIHGPSAARRLCRMWCRTREGQYNLPFHHTAPDKGARVREEKVVDAAPFMIGTVIKPVVQKLDSCDQAELRTKPGGERKSERRRWTNWGQIESLEGRLAREEISLLKWAIRMYHRLEADTATVERDCPSLIDLFLSHEM